MTGGMVVVLGETGQNFGAGMSSGVAYVLDRGDHFPSRCNTELVELHRIHDEREKHALRTVVEEHARKTRSKHAERILEQWEQLQEKFWCITPRRTHLSARDFVEVGESDATVSSIAH